MKTLAVFLAVAREQTGHCMPIIMRARVLHVGV